MAHTQRSASTPTETGKTASGTTTGKRRNLFKQIAQIYRFTRAGDPQLPWLLLGAAAAPIVLGVALAAALHMHWLMWIMTIVTAIMLGFLCFTLVLTRRADKVGYAQLEGRPGAAISIVSNLSRAGFTFPQEPVWADPRTKDAIWRGTGINGIYLLGEGDYGRVMRAMDRQEHAIRSVTAGSAIPVYRVSVGNGTKQVPLKQLRRVMLRYKTYQPTNHKNKLVAILHPRRRFLMTKAELEILNDRLRTLQLKHGYGIPKGIDPTKAQRISRRAMRGK